MSNAERDALAMYAIASRDYLDFIDMLSDASPEAIQLLLQMCEHPGNTDTDIQLNKLMAQSIRTHLKENV